MDTQGNLIFLNEYFRAIIGMPLTITIKLMTILIALIWAVNGLWCKVLNLIPRHTEIVAAIIGSQFSRQITIAIGLAETFFAIWILTGKFRKPTALLQILLVLIMNIIEFSVVPDLLLWGKMNLIFAILFSFIIYVHAFRLKPQANT